MYSLAIFASVTLLVQIVPVADAAGSQTRKDSEEQAIKNEEALSKLKGSLNVALKALKDAKKATDLAKDNYQIDTSNKALLKIWEDARVAEAQARLDYNKTLEAVRDFKPIKTKPKVENLETDFAKENELQDAKIPSPQKQAETIAKEKVITAINAWKATLVNLEPAIKIWKDVPSTTNLNALKQVIQLVQDAVKNIQDAKDALKLIQNS